MGELREKRKADMLASKEAAAAAKSIAKTARVEALERRAAELKEFREVAAAEEAALQAELDAEKAAAATRLTSAEAQEPGKSNAHPEENEAAQEGTVCEGAFAVPKDEQALEGEIIDTVPGVADADDTEEHSEHKVSPVQ